MQVQVHRVCRIRDVILELLILNEDERRVLTRFRVSAHYLEIEKKRYIGVKTEDRTQIINNIKNVNTNFNNLPNKSKLIWLMSSEDNFIIKNTSSLLCSILSLKHLVVKKNETVVSE